MTTDGPPQGPDAVPPPLPPAYGTPPAPEPADQRPAPGQPYAQPSGPSYAQPYGQPYSQPYSQPYGQPYAQPYAQPGQPQPGYAAQPAPDNYLVWAILSTVLCCLPLGVVSIVYAAQVNDKWLRGDAAGAMESSRKAKQFATWSAIVHVALLAVVLVVYVGFFAVLIGTGVSTAP